MHPVARIPEHIITSLKRQDLSDLRKFIKGKLPDWFATRTDNQGIWFSSMDDPIKDSLSKNPYMRDNHLRSLWKFDSQHISSHYSVLFKGEDSDNVLWKQGLFTMLSFLHSPYIGTGTVRMMMIAYLHNPAAPEPVGERLRILYYRLIEQGKLEEFSLPTMTALVEVFSELGESYMGEALRKRWMNKGDIEIMPITP